MSREPLLDVWLPLEPRGKGRAMFRSVPRPDAPYLERLLDEETGAVIEFDPLQPRRGKPVKHYALRNIRPMAYGESTTEHEAKYRRIFILAVAAEEAFQTMKGAVRLDWAAYFPPLMSDNRRKKEAKVRGLVSHIKKPDKDNIEKLIADAMSEIVFFDDCQIDFGTGAKVYSHREGIRVRVYASEPAKVKAWVDANFPWAEETFELEG